MRSTIPAGHERAAVFARRRIMPAFLATPLLVPRLLASLLLASLLTGAQAAGRTPQGTSRMKTLDLWTVIDYLPTRLPFSTDKIESALNVVLAKDSENEYFSFYKAQDLALSNGVVIEAIDLRIRKEQPHPGFLVIRLAGACVPRAEVLRRYEGLDITDHPRGRSLDEQTSYSRREVWGKLSFGFAERSPDCLRSVVFNPD